MGPHSWTSLGIPAAAVNNAEPGKDIKNILNPGSNPRSNTGSNSGPGLTLVNPGPGLTLVLV